MTFSITIFCLPKTELEFKIVEIIITIIAIIIILCINLTPLKSFNTALQIYPSMES